MRSRSLSNDVKGQGALLRGKVNQMYVTVRRKAVACSMCLAFLLVGCNSGSPGATKPAATPSPTVDAMTQAYVDLLHKYYVPFATAHDKDEACIITVYRASFANPARDLLVRKMGACRDPLTASLAGAQVLQIQLAGATPPARWQTQHAALQKGAQGYSKFGAALLHDIDTNDVEDFLSAVDQIRKDVGTSFCDPVNQINAGPPPVIPPLPVFDSSICQ
jgi:hypothetical protein